MSEVAKNVQKVIVKHGGKDLEFSKTDKEAQDLWQGRKAALWSVLALKDNSRVWTTDVWCVYWTLTLILIDNDRSKMSFRLTITVSLFRK